MKTKHLPIIIGISLPIIFIVAISIVIFTPSLYIKPQHNFIYTTNDSYYPFDKEYKNTYVVEDGHIALEAVAPQENVEQTKTSPTLYLYDVVENTINQITFEEAQNYTIDPGPSSPDGYLVEYQYSHDGIFELFGSDTSNSGYFISKNNGKKKLNGLAEGRYYGPGNFNLIGWIK